MVSKFRTGQLLPHPDFLQAIPRKPMIDALIAHCVSDHLDGQPILTRHEHNGQRFVIETAGDRRSTVIRLV